MRRSTIFSTLAVPLAVVGVTVGNTTAAASGRAPASSAAAWSIDRTAVSGDSTRLTGLDCSDTEADGICFAVGSATAADQSHHLTVERRTGAGWVDVPAATPHNASDSALAAVSCVSVTRCIAVGRAADGRTVRTLVEQSSSTGWRPRYSPGPSAMVAELSAISCVSKNFCVAVGDAGSRTKREALIEGWDGKHWHLIDAPDSGLPSTQLSGVDCASPVFCVAVGAGGRSATTPTTLVEEVWNGSTWSVSTSGRGGRAVLTTVDCVSARFCLAVGDRSIAQRQLLVAERWDGTSWAAVKVPQISGTAAQLTGISCVSTTYCLAVGTFIDGVIGSDTIGVAWNGSRFVAGPAPIFYSPAFAVRCFSAAQCVGVGAGAQNLSGIDWEGESVPPHDGAQLPTQLRAVSCMTSTSCLAVGTEYDDGLPFALLSNGAQWRLTGAWAEGFGVADNAASCGDTTPTSCLLSGSINLHGPTPPNTEVERFDGRYYNFEPGVPNVGASKAISCIDDFCAVAGVHAVAIFDGTSWTSMPIVSPGGSRVELDGLDCLSPDDCVLVGGYEDASPDVESVLVERWDGTSWTVVPAPAGRSGRVNALHAVTCTSPDSCVAVGTSHGSSDASLVYEWNGVAWRSIAHPGTGTGLDGVACASAGACIAVGPAGAALASTSGTWTRVRVAVPPGDTGALPDLTGITYVGGTYHAVGSYQRFGDRAALAESMTVDQRGD